MIRAAPRPRSLLDFTAAVLCLWAAGYHTPVGALVRDVVARIGKSHANTRPLLAYYSGGVFEAVELPAPLPTPTPVPDVTVLTAIPAGSALGRGLFAAALPLTPQAREPVDALARRYQLPFATPDDAALVMERATRELGSEEAAVVAAFSGVELASYAVSRAKAEGRPLTLEVLGNRLPPSSAAALASASSALMLGTAYGLSWPVAPGTRVTSPFGFRTHPILGRGQFHTGVDLSVPEGTEVKVTAAGTVRRASEDAVNGKVVIVDHGRGVSTAYCHNSELLVRTGEALEAGQVIAKSGTTGRSTGPHVHYQLELGHKPMDPFAFRGSEPVLIDPPAPREPTTPRDPVVDRQALKKAFDQFGPPSGSEE